ncbi:LA2681 family HEPN domain-containing protein [Chitinophaga sp.]|uniref:LA2681 family HEPN domain-containing protein n=1 Tax=Chitinophaga sp. TaxID=1869181 RepID=UPI0031D67B34
MNYDIEQITSFSDFNTVRPSSAIECLGAIFEEGREKCEVNLIQKGLELAESTSLETFSDNEKMIFHYYWANGWSYLYKLTHRLNSEDFWKFETVEIENEIIHLRKAISFSEKDSNTFVKAQIYTNLGGIFSHIGRFVEAIHYWYHALLLQPGFGMAIGNLGFGLAHYARVLYDDGHRIIFCRYAYKYLLYAAQRPDVYEEGKLGFYNTAKMVESRYGVRFLKEKQHFRRYGLGKNNDERKYRKWCMDNALFLNPLNDFIYKNVVAHDCLYLPTISQPFDEGPTIHTMFNQIKQEYVSARFLLFEGLKLNKPHYSDRGNLQMDTLDYAVYSLNTEKMKIAFRTYYSLFDKIAYILNQYLKLGNDPTRISFRNIWYDDNKKGNSKTLRQTLTDRQNWPLRGLYWISKDLFEKENDFSFSLMLEAQELAKIRNFIEHKSFKIVEFGQTAIVDNDFTYQISREDFGQRIFVLMKMIRSAIINLSLTIHLEELKKEKKPSIPITFHELDMDFKY